jgi:hypothetical protein
MKSQHQLDTPKGRGQRFRRLTKDLHEEMYSFEVCQLIIVRINAAAEEETGISAVDDLVAPELVRSAMPSARISQAMFDRNSGFGQREAKVFQLTSTKLD